MNYLDYLKKDQEIPYRIFSNAIARSEIFQTYLLSGEIGTPLLEVAIFLAKRILSNSKNIEEVDKSVDRRIDDDTFDDLIILDAKKTNISIDDIRYIETKFSRSSQKNNGKKLYIINCVEYLQNDSCNALLKFLEEPLPDTYAILTSENEYAVLPTIRSRSQIIHFSSLDRKKLIDDSVSLGVSRNLAEILCFLYNDKDAIKKEAKDQAFLFLLNVVESMLKNIKNRDSIYFAIESSFKKKDLDKQKERLFLDILIIFFKESLKYLVDGDSLLSSYVNILKELSSPNIDLGNSIISLMKLRDDISRNVNLNLINIEMVKEIFGEKQ
jgi:DNA polymerase-3 subunit delta'